MKCERYPNGQILKFFNKIGGTVLSSISKRFFLRLKPNNIRKNNLPDTPPVNNYSTLGLEWDKVNNFLNWKNSNLGSILFARWNFVKINLKFSKGRFDQSLGAIECKREARLINQPKWLSQIGKPNCFYFLFNYWCDMQMEELNTSSHF